ncbi:MAG: OprO/OprP family phosphate-selective porin [Thermoguttaceae bacterium]|nr:OprO/OprP family phosphate-selective porin [Thermoguttaceae bacterium]MDW8078540.1 porin [Thermoguttaceae bacterium]
MLPRPLVILCLAALLFAQALFPRVAAQEVESFPWLAPSTSWEENVPPEVPAQFPNQFSHSTGPQSPTSPAEASGNFSPTGMTQLSLEEASRRLAELEARLSALEKQRASANTHQGPKDVSSERFTIRPSAVAQADYVNYPRQNDASLAAYGDLNDYFEFRRLFLGVEGTGYGVLDYRVILNFEAQQIIRDQAGARLAETDLVQIRDVYLSHRDVPLLGTVFLGNLKVPYSMEEQTSDRFTSFMERAAPSDTFAPKRRVGILVTDTSPSDAIGWSTGVFFANISQETKERVHDCQGVDWGARTWWCPVFVADGRIVLHFGGSYVFTSDEDGLVRFGVRPETHEGPFALDTGTFLAQRVHRAGLEAAVVAGPISVQGELYGVRTVAPPGGADNQFYGAYVCASYFLTGEHRPYERKRGVFNRLAPYTNFWWVKTKDGTSFGWGAWELAARWSWTDLDEPMLASPLAGQMHNMTFALTWYWNPQVRMMFEWIHSFTSVRGQADVPQTDILGVSWRADF